jgi:DNA-binding NtrC family response regulator
MPKLVVIDDDRSVQFFVREALVDSEIEVFAAEDELKGLELIRVQQPDVVLLDVMLPGTSGLEIFDKIHRFDSKLPVIFITAGGNSDTAIEAMKLGAFDYVLKPLDVSRIRDLVALSVETRRQMQTPVALPGRDVVVARADQLVGRCPEMLEVYKAIGRVAPQDLTVLIRGESGTGKELIARAIYHHSARRGKPYLAVNCAAIPEALLESELFGHEKGAFTGADRRRIGKFEQCSGGTIFLDEVGDMVPMIQAKLLRLLQEQQFERVGGGETIQSDVRIITATNRNLEEMVEEGEFRGDLFYRLNGFTIKLPPLRDRGDDLRVLIESMVVRFARELGKELQGIAPAAMDILQAYDWPGNVRELQGVLRKALLNATGPVLVPEFLPEEVRPGRHAEGGEAGSESDSDLESADLPGDLPRHDLARFIEQRLSCESTDLYAETLELVERYLVTRVLRQTSGNQSRAAEILGITRGSLRNKIHSLGISIDHVVQVDNARTDEGDEE